MIQILARRRAAVRRANTVKTIARAIIGLTLLAALIVGGNAVVTLADSVFADDAPVEQVWT
jgi:hypothetical protein